MPIKLEDLVLDAFASRVGQSFRIDTSGNGSIDAELIEARSLAGTAPPSSTRSTRRTPFALLFRTAQRAVLPQRIYAVAHAELGAYDLFLVPIGPDAKGMVYEAIFT